MNKIVQIKVFNSLLDQFFEFLETSFPYFRSDVILTRSTISFVRNSNPRLVVEEFFNYTSPYKHKIFNCDEAFFLNFEKNIKGVDFSNDNLLFGSKMKSVWLSSDTTDLHKARIWLFFQKLITAAEKVII